MDTLRSRKILVAEQHGGWWIDLLPDMPRATMSPFRKRLCRRGPALVVLVSITALLVVSSCASLNRTVTAPPLIPGSTFVGNQGCVDCHGNIVRKFPASPHARFYRSQDPSTGISGCESCHGAGSQHVKVGGGRDRFIVNPGREATVCFNCHVDTHSEFRLPNSHPVIQGRINCVDCHDPHGPDIMKPGRGLMMAGWNQACASCHREQTKPFVYEHEAMREGCIVCHQPHGSVHRKMLTERDSNLCLRCHAQIQMGAAEILIGRVDHSFNLRQGSCWSAGCHTAVHGSNVDPTLRY